MEIKLGEQVLPSAAEVPLLASEDAQVLQSSAEVPLLASEYAPVVGLGKAVNAVFQLLVTVGILIAKQAAEYGNGWGWWAMVHGILLLFLVGGGAVLIISKEEEEGFRRKKMAIGVATQAMQQLMAINATISYSDTLFDTATAGEGGLAPGHIPNITITVLIIGAVSVAATLASLYGGARYVHPLKARKRLLEAFDNILFSQVLTGLILLGKRYSPYADDSDIISGVMVLQVYLFVACFTWSWGPLGWLVPAPLETFPAETRTPGFVFAVRANLLLTFILATQGIMMCNPQPNVFFFLPAWIIVMAFLVQPLSQRFISVEKMIIK